VAVRLSDGVSRVEIESLESATVVSYGGPAGSQFVVGPGHLVSFTSGGKPIMRTPDPGDPKGGGVVSVEPGNPKGGGIFLFASDLRDLDTDQLLGHTVRVSEHLVLPLADADQLDLQDVQELAEHAESEGLTLRVAVGVRRGA
jgi:hypothetical protein